MCDYWRDTPGLSAALLFSTDEPSKTTSTGESAAARAAQATSASAPDPWDDISDSDSEV